MLYKFSFNNVTNRKFQTIKIPKTDFSHFTPIYGYVDTYLLSLNCNYFQEANIMEFYMCTVNDNKSPTCVF